MYTYIIRQKNSESKDMNFLKAFKLWLNFDQKGCSDLHYLSSAIYDYNKNKCSLRKTGKHRKTQRISEKSPFVYPNFRKTHTMLNSNKYYREAVEGTPKFGGFTVHEMGSH